MIRVERQDCQVGRKKETEGQREVEGYNGLVTGGEQVTKRTRCGEVQCSGGWALGGRRGPEAALCSWLRPERLGLGWESGETLRPEAWDRRLRVVD